MLTRWLPDTENKLPPNASHQVGVGAFVLNERREVLVVQVGGSCSFHRVRPVAARRTVYPLWWSAEACLFECVSTCPHAPQASARQPQGGAVW